MTDALEALPLCCLCLCISTRRSALCALIEAPHTP